MESTVHQDKTYYLGDEKIIVNEERIRKCIDYFFDGKKLKSHMDEGGNHIPHRQEFNVVILNMKSKDYLESLFPKELANIITNYNGHQHRHIIINTQKNEIVVRQYYNLGTQTTPIFRTKITDAKMTNVDTYCFIMNIKRDDENEDDLWIDSDASEEQMTCLKYVFDHNLFNSFSSMSYEQLFLECTKISKDIFKMKDYPTFFVLVYGIIIKKKYNDVLVSQIVYNLLKDKLRTKRN